MTIKNEWGGKKDLSVLGVNAIVIEVERNEAMLFSGQRSGVNTQKKLFYKEINEAVDNVDVTNQTTYKSKHFIYKSFIFTWID